MDHVFFQGSIGDLILLGKADSTKSPAKNVKRLFDKECLPKNLATIVKLPISSWVLNDLDVFSHNSEPSY